MTMEAEFSPARAGEGKLLVVEGIDGSGKTSHSKRLAALLQAQWRRFPNRETPFGKLIDMHLKRQWSAAYDPVEGPPSGAPEASLMDGLVFQAIQIANRVEFAVDFRSTLQLSHIVCDRYWPSGYAYGGADGLDKRYMTEVHKGLLSADLYVLFDVDVEEAFKRMSARDNGTERYEGNRDFLRTVADNYRELWARQAEENPRNWVRVDANGTVEETWERLKAAVKPALSY